MAGHSWCAFSYRRRVEVEADNTGEPVATLSNIILDLIGAEPGDELIVTVEGDKALIVKKLETRDSGQSGSGAAIQAAYVSPKLRPGLGDWGA
jgi:hypothetical protein